MQPPPPKWGFPVYGDCTSAGTRTWGGKLGGGKGLTPLRGLLWAPPSCLRLHRRGEPGLSPPSPSLKSFKL